MSAHTNRFFTILARCMRTTNVGGLDRTLISDLAISRLIYVFAVDLSLFRAPRYLLNKSHIDEYTKEVGISEPMDDFDDRNALYSL